MNCHPDRSEPGFPVTLPSPTPAYAAFSKESRMKFANATDLNRKSGERSGGTCCSLVQHPTRPESSLVHRERSASQIFACYSACWRGVEGPRQCYLTYTVRSFLTTEPHKLRLTRLAAGAYPGRKTRLPKRFRVLREKYFGKPLDRNPP
jgi:hypothetical protein